MHGQKNIKLHKLELGCGLGIYFKQDPSTQNITQKLAEPVRIQNLGFVNGVLRKVAFLPFCHAEKILIANCNTEPAKVKNWGKNKHVLNCTLYFQK